MTRSWLLKAAEAGLPFARHMPFVVQQTAIEVAARKLFARPLKEGAFDLLQGRWLRIDVNDLQLSWTLTCDQGYLRVAQRRHADVRISGNWRDFLLLASRQEDPDTLFFRRRLRIEGDTELGLGIKNLIDALDPDDLPHGFWSLLRSAGQAVQQSG
ncbi:lipid carrier protein [Pseudomonas sp. TTU2014-080ASC]|nr:lipid carrier protein [Pseudomonas sp. TTU2014-080ASC]